VGTDGQEHGVEAAGLAGFQHVRDLGVVGDGDAHVHNALDLGVEHLAGQTVFRNAETHHAAGHGTGLVHRHGMAQARQVVGRREAGRTRADNQHFLSGLRLCSREPPAPGDGLITQKPLDRVDSHRLIDLRPVAGPFAGVITDPTHGGGERVVFDQLAPGLLVVPRLRMKQPGLDVFPGGALVVARRFAADVHRPRIAPRAGVVDQGTAHVKGDGKGLLHADEPQ
jgi:hypothetical protein